MKQKLSEGSKAGYDSRVGASLGRGPNLRKKDIAAPWSSTFPAPGATLDLDFANDRGFVRGVGQGRSMDAVTFTRASAGQYIDSTGTLQSAAINTPRFDWASTAQVAILNLLRYTEQFNNAYWEKQGTAAVTADAGADPNGNTTADRLYWTGTAARALYVFGSAAGNLAQIPTQGQTTTFSIWIKANDVSPGKLRLRLTDFGNIVFSSDIIPTADWTRYSITQTRANNSTFIVSLESDAANTNAPLDILIWGAQLEFGSAATNYQAVGASSPTNTPLAANPTSNGLLIEESRANRLLWCRDATNAAWTKTNVTAAKDQTGIDGVANAASSLTASADAGTCIQTITLASGSRTGSVFLKRITGTGNVQVTLDGSTWSTVDLSASEWRRIVLSGTVTNPTVGIRLATNGDAVAMDYGQIEDGAFATSPILTTTASVTRSVDVASMLTTTYPTIVNYSNFTFIATGTLNGLTAANSFGGFSNLSGSTYLSFGNTNNNRFDVFNGNTIVQVPDGVVTGKEYRLAASVVNQSYASISLNNNTASNQNALASGFAGPNRDQTTMFRFAIGSRAGDSGFWNGTIKRVAVISGAKPYSALQAITSGAT